MSTDRTEPRQARGINLKEALAIGLDEAFSALSESLHGLTDEQLWAFPLEDRHNIVTLSEHCLQCLDLYGCEVHGQDLTFKAEERFDIWLLRGLLGLSDKTGWPEQHWA